MNPFKGKVAIVTGGASGIGRAICERLGTEGANVIIADIDKAGAEQVATLIASAGGTAQASRLDVTSPEAIEALVDKTIAEKGRLDYMFNNAGIAVHGEVRDIDYETWEKILNINLRGVIYGTTAAYKRMVEQGSGHIINTASLLGLLWGIGLATPYAATKHAIVGLSTSLRTEGKGLGVKVSVVCPGFIKSGLYDAATVAKAGNQEFFERVLPFPRMDTDKAVDEIFKGVERNKAIIAFPFSARVMWLANRVNANFIGWFTGGTLKRFREIRKG